MCPDFSLKYFFCHPQHKDTKSRPLMSSKTYHYLKQMRPSATAALSQAVLYKSKKKHASSKTGSFWDTHVIFQENVRAHIQNTSFFVTYKWAQSASVFVPGKPLQLSIMKLSSLLGPFISYKVVNTAQGSYSQQFIFF